MTTHRLYSFFGLIIVLALVVAGVMGLPMLVGALNQPDAARAARLARLDQLAAIKDQDDAAAIRALRLARLDELAALKDASQR